MLPHWQPCKDLAVSPSTWNIILKETSEKRFWKDVDQKLTKQSDITSHSEHGCRKGVDEGIRDNRKLHYVTRHRVYDLHFTVMAQDDHCLLCFYAMQCILFVTALQVT
jgi:hypothetical protein